MSVKVYYLSKYNPPPFPNAIICALFRNAQVYLIRRRAYQVEGTFVNCNVFVPDDCDTVFFAHCYPFTFSDQCNFNNKICTFSNKDKVRKTNLCKSLAGNDVVMLIITNFLSDPAEIASRKCIILTSRVHPGESNSSIIMCGVIDFLVSEEQDA